MFIVVYSVGILKRVNNLNTHQLTMDKQDVASLRQNEQVFIVEKHSKNVILTTWLNLENIMLN